MTGDTGTERKRKQRVTGALVLVAAAVILYPMLFSREEQTEKLSLVIPEPPPAMDIPDYVEYLDKPMALPEEPADFEPPPAAGQEQPTLDEKNIPISWTLQLAALSRPDSAEQLQDRLRKDGYRAYTREGVGGKGQTLYRVYVGPELRKDKLMELRRTIEQSYRLKGMVVRFRP